MNRITFTFFLMLASLLSQAATNGWPTGGIHINVTARPSTGGEEPEVPVKDPQLGHRIPSMRIPVTISLEGVEISGVDSGDILTYEICDLDGGCVGIFVDGISFAETLFSLTGEYEVRFSTDEYLYIGYVEL